MSVDNPLDARIERVIVAELLANRLLDLTSEEDCAVIAHSLRVRLQRAGVLADVKRTPERERETLTRDQDNDDPLSLDPYSPQ